jgi:hypothetical protein
VRVGGTACWVEIGEGVTKAVGGSYVGVRREK